ncbi:hypothetical protein HID58_039702 [Brassica napus]|uniref:(rape) hypothetical protein n=2 Tax=Brassica TaxID=3705 RepID=A0A817BTR8_BRANA|nr:hypothetical protein HID58_039702 [Brassica napus]CAF2359512.1 unnamed protein product [Brassica napus]
MYNGHLIAICTTKTFPPHTLFFSAFKLVEANYKELREAILFLKESCVMTNVVEMKVNLHCDECIRKILKAIKKIEDIETYDVDTQLNKVTVTGNVTDEQVIKVLQKVRKTAVKWDQANQTLFPN